MSCITQLLELKGDKEFLRIHDEVVIEGGGLYKDYEYLIVFVSFGHRCGYVALKENLDAEPDLECHGGVTFYSNTHTAKDLLPIPCNDFWVGFDAAHHLDAKDMELAEKYFPDNGYVEFKKNNPDSFDSLGIHRTFYYMEKECHSIIEQLLVLQTG
jgi:hypothetical protein